MNPDNKTKADQIYNLNKGLYNNLQNSEEKEDIFSNLRKSLQKEGKSFRTEFVSMVYQKSSQKDEFAYDVLVNSLLGLTKEEKYDVGGLGTIACSGHTRDMVAIPNSFKCSSSSQFKDALEKTQASLSKKYLEQHLGKSLEEIRDNPSVEPSNKLEACHYRAANNRVKSLQNSYKKSLFNKEEFDCSKENIPNLLSRPAMKIIKTAFDKHLNRYKESLIDDSIEYNYPRNISQPAFLAVKEDMEKGVNTLTKIQAIARGNSVRDAITKSESMQSYVTSIRQVDKTTEELGGMSIS